MVLDSTEAIGFNFFPGKGMGIGRLPSGKVSGEPMRAKVRQWQKCEWERKIETLKTEARVLSVEDLCPLQVSWSEGEVEMLILGPPWLILELTHHNSYLLTIQYWRVLTFPFPS